MEFTLNICSFYQVTPPPYDTHFEILVEGESAVTLPHADAILAASKVERDQRSKGLSERGIFTSHVSYRSEN